MGIKFKAGPDGEAKEFDAAGFLQDTYPEARILDYDSAKGQVRFDMGQGEQSFDLHGFMRDSGMEPSGEVGDFNAPERALDASTVGLGMRARLGLATSESGDIKQIIAAAKSASPDEADRAMEQNQGRVLAILKKQYGDAKVVNGEFVYKERGVWRKANAPGTDFGDVVEFAAQNGLNLVGSIAGGVLGAAAGILGGGTAGTAVAPGPGTVAGAAGGLVGGAVAGSTVGSAIMEGAEELLSHAIEGDGFDVGQTAADIALEGILNLTGEGIAKGVSVGAKALAASKPGIAIAHGAAATAQGLKKFAAMAAGEVKDSVAGILGNLGPGMTSRTTRAMLESPATVDIAKKAAKRAVTDGDPGALYREMTDTVQETYKAIKKENQKEFGAFIKEVGDASEQPGNSGAFSLDLGDMRKKLNTIRNNMVQHDRSTFGRAVATVDNLIEHAPKKRVARLDKDGQIVFRMEPDTAVVGRKAFNALREVLSAVEHNLENVGQYSAQGASVQASTLHQLNSMRAYVDGLLDAGIKKLNLSDKSKLVAKKYGEVKDNYRVLAGRVLSEKMDIDNTIKILRGELNETQNAALEFMNKAFPQVRLNEKLDVLRAMQSGIETRHWFAVPNAKATALQLTTGAGAAGIAYTNPLAGILAVAPMISPRWAGYLAREAAGVGITRKVAGAVKKPISASAEATAKGLTRMAASAGFLASLPRQTAIRMLKDPDMFNKWAQEANQFTNSANEATKAAISKKAVEKANGR